LSSRFSIFDFQRGLLLAETEVEICYKDRSQSYPCKIYFDLTQATTILVEPLEPITTIARDMSGLFLLATPGVTRHIECHAAFSKQQWNENKSGVWVILAPNSSNIEVDRSSTLVRIYAGILNLGHYWTDRPNSLLSYFKLGNSDWAFDFTPVTDSTLLYPPFIQNNSYFFTHHVCAQKCDGGLFSPSQAPHLLNDLTTFLSFCHGHWVSTALTYGIDEHGNVGMEEWGTRKVSPWRTGSNWLDMHHGNGMAELFPKVMQLLTKSSDWRNAIQIAIYWYVRADTNVVGPDGSCIILQAALERLAWHLLVRDRRSLSEDGFSRLPAADQLRLLLSALSIPSELPPGLIDLGQAAKAFHWRDGPQAFVEIRNQIVHLPRKSDEVGACHITMHTEWRNGIWNLSF
jgi:hypothetical protein